MEPRQWFASHASTAFTWSGFNSKGNLRLSIAASWLLLIPFSLLLLLLVVVGNESINLLNWSLECECFVFSQTILNFGIVIVVSMSACQRFQTTSCMICCPFSTLSLFICSSLCF